MPYKDPAAQRAYMKTYLANHYAANKPAYKARAKSHDKKRRVQSHDIINKHLRENPCIGCGEDDLIVLEFDHRAGEEKLFDIGAWKNRKFSLRTLRAEIAKCDVRCANCHRRKTYMERGFTHRG